MTHKRMTKRRVRTEREKPNRKRKKKITQLFKTGLISKIKFGTRDEQVRTDCFWFWWNLE